MNELYFIDEIKILMTFHGSKLHFIKWISSSMEIYYSSLKFHPQKLEWKVHAIFIHWKFTNDIQWMYEPFWNAWMNCNGIMSDQGEIKCWFNCWNLSQWNHKWAFSGWCANGCWFTLAHVVYGSKWATRTPKLNNPTFPLCWWSFKCFVREKKNHWNREVLRQRGSMEDKILEF
jgi:hypothetical protein